MTNKENQILKMFQTVEIGLISLVVATIISLALILLFYFAVRSFWIFAGGLFLFVIYIMSTKENKDNFWLLHPISFIKNIIRLRRALNDGKPKL